MESLSYQSPVIVSNFVKELLAQKKPERTLFIDAGDVPTSGSNAEILEKNIEDFICSENMVTAAEFILTNKKFGEIILKNNNNQFDFMVSNFWNMSGTDDDIYAIEKILASMTNDGIGIFVVSVDFGASQKDKEYLDKLEEKGYFLQALIEMKYSVELYDHVMDVSLVIITKEQYSKVFIASIDGNNNVQDIVDHFLRGKSAHNLIKGDIIDLREFRGFNNYNNIKKIAQLQRKYKDYKQFLLGDIAKEVITTKNVFKERENDLYIPRIKKMNDVQVHVDTLTKKQKDYFQIVLDDKIVKSGYLQRYFMTEMGQISLETALERNLEQLLSKYCEGKPIESIYEYIIDEDHLNNIIVPIPKIETQELIIGSYHIIKKVTDTMYELEKDLSFNPNSANEITNQLVGVLEKLSQLSKEDQIRHYIRQGESLTVEFKQTFSKDVKNGGNKPQKDLETSSLKNIVALSNKEGGVLLIGVTDDGEIYGIENDKYVNDDKYLLRFKDIFKERIGLQYDDLITYEIVRIDGKKILFVRCKKSDREVYLDSKDFYVRTNPAVEKLEGPEMIAYVREHFNR